jgi:hypothetical protein
VVVPHPAQHGGAGEHLRGGYADRRAVLDMAPRRVRRMSRHRPGRRLVWFLAGGWRLRGDVSASCGGAVSRGTHPGRSEIRSYQPVKVNVGAAAVQLGALGRRASQSGVARVDFDQPGQHIGAALIVVITAPLAVSKRSQRPPH